MNTEEPPAERESLFIEELDAKQRNITWPDTLRNGRSVDEFLWKGSADAPTVQRIGAMIFGAFFMLGGVAVASMGIQAHAAFAGVPIAIGAFYVGARIFRNGWLKRKV